MRYLTVLADRGCMVILGYMEPVLRQQKRSYLVFLVQILYSMPFIQPKYQASMRGERCTKYYVLIF
jgi:hypothetical protein